MFALRQRESRARGAGRTQEAILEAATSVFAAKGLAGARIDEIASLSGSNVRMIYHYFGSKEGLYEAVISSHVSLEQSLATTADSDDPVENIQKILEAYFDFCVENPSYVSLMLWEAVSGWKTLEKVVAEEAALRNQMLRSLQDGKDRGKFRHDLDVEIVLPGLIANMLLFFPLYGSEVRLTESNTERKRVRKQLVTCCLESLKA
jgi:TetR/AcrR family transcriptional regulator